MTNAVLKFGGVVTFSLLLGILSGNANKIQAQINIQSTTNITVNDVQSRLLGQWEIEDKAGKIVLIWVFTPENKIIVLIPSENSFIGYEFGRYEVVSNTQPMQILVSDLVDENSKVTLATLIFEFTDTGLRVDFPQEKPFRFTSASLNLQKLSDTSTLPPNTQLFTQTELQTNRVQENRSNILYLLDYQRSHYRETAQFSSSIEQLSSGNIPTETTNYRYQIIPQTDITQSVITAQAKRPDLRSYAGVVLVIGQVTITVACETDEPSTTPPTLPVTPKNGVNELKCPIGSHLIGQP